MEAVEFPPVFLVAVDFDNVIASSEKAKVAFARQIYGIEITPPIKRRFVVERDHKMTPQQYRRLQLEVGGFWKWARQMECIEGVVPVVPLLHQQGIRFSIVTSRTDEIVAGVQYKLLSVAKRWLVGQGLFGYFQDIEGAGYHKSKVPVLEELEPCPFVFMDDDLEKLLAACGVVENLFLFSRPHNLNQELPADIKRIDSWWHFRDVALELKSELRLAVR